jgi:hypothetical protein
MFRFSCERKLASEYSASKRRRYAPEKCRGCDEQISAERVGRCLGIVGVQSDATESDDDGGSKIWSRRLGSKPIMTSPSSNMVGVSLLP